MTNPTHGDIYLMIGELKGAVEAGNRQQASNAVSVAELRKQHGEMQACLERQTVALNHAVDRLERVAVVADDYTKLKNRGIGIFFVFGIVFAGLWEGAKLVFKKWGA
jgi:hypothetical protein